MPWSPQDIIQVITAVSSLLTVLGGTLIAIRQAGIGRKMDEAKVAAVGVAAKLTENTEIRAAQIEDVKRTVMEKVEEVKQAVKKNGNGNGNGGGH